ncbi:type 2 periplasmic-binding domain-containing protein [Noviherbaspirillum pedocola]|uniref:C4-dicarboxylate ABC transporter substrate-binding protein n=1 Tax=Noviherbaspirillum pedocola TaxID=2801341 RepID=A0A934T3C3_9BURK|nr:hypothetical protein [Noviherbaspirillum pedocola]MBK4739112.1 hypothetical protein [Noviherbaspirillum pedocola]
MMLRENRRVLTTVLCATVGMMTSLTSQAATTFTLNPPIGSADAIAKGMELWCEKAASATQGRVLCAVGSVRVPPENAAAALQSGKVDLICFPHKTDPQRYKISRIADLPLLGDFAETTSIAYQRIYNKSQLMANEHKGYKVLAVFTQPPSFLFTSQLRPERVPAAQALRTSTDVGAPRNPLRKRSNTVQGAPAAPEKSGNEDGSRYLIGTTTEFKALPGHATMRSALMFKGGVSNVSYVFALNQNQWNRLSARDKEALDRISGVEAAALMGRTLDAQAWKANISMHDAGIAFYPPTEAILVRTRNEFTAADKDWIAKANSAGIHHPASLLTTFRKAISQQEEAE